MTEEVFLKSKFTPYMAIDHIYSRRGVGLEKVECMLISIDFEERLLKLVPFDLETYENNEFWVRCEHVGNIHDNPELL